LIRFEDTYGVCDLFCARLGIPYIPEKEWHDIVKVTDSIYISSGLGTKGCFRRSADGFRDIVEAAPDVILTVFDLDSGVDGRHTMSGANFLNRAKRFESDVKGVLPNATMMYIPTVYAAETVMLYQYRKSLGIQGSIEELVHNRNTWTFQSTILAIFNKCDSLHLSKKMRDYIDISTLMESLDECLKANLTLNGPVLRFLRDIYLSGLTLNQTVMFLDVAASVFNYYLDTSVKLTVAGVELDTNTSLYSIKDKFEFFPKRLK
jgi:hypothetical protein